MALGMPRGLPGSCASCAGPAIRGEGRHGTLEQSRRQQLRGKAPSCAPFSLGGHKLPHQALGARETEAGGRGGPDVLVATMVALRGVPAREVERKRGGSRDLGALHSCLGCVLEKQALVLGELARTPGNGLVCRTGQLWRLL